MSNDVIVYIWKPTLTRFGHVALAFEDEGFYVSYWPNWDDPKAYSQKPKLHPGSAFFANAPSFQNRTLKNDTDDEGPVDYIIRFSSLNRAAIKKEYERIDRSDNTRWHVLSRKSIFLKDASVEFYSCAGLVAHLLQTGGGICANFNDRCASDRVLSGCAISPGSLAIVANVYEQAEKRGEKTVSLPWINQITSYILPKPR